MNELLQKNKLLTERDLELINALQVAPRARWGDLSGVLGVHPTTLSRRWEQLTDAGMARVSSTPGPTLLQVMDLAFVELTCQNNQVQEVAEQLVPNQQVMSIHFIAGPGHLLLTVAAAERSLSTFLLRTIGGLDGVLHYSVRSITSQLIGPHRWHFRALPAAKLRRLSQLDKEATKAGEGTSLAMDGPNQALMGALWMDGRTSLRDLADIAGISPVAAARRVGRLIGGGYITMRCDVARIGAGRSHSAILWGSIPPDRLPRTADSIQDRVAALRGMFTVTGANNIHIAAWLNNPVDLLHVEQQLLEAIDGLTVVDRRIVLRIFKFNGVRLNEDGTLGQVIPLVY